MKALQRNSRINVSYIESGTSFECRKLSGKFDAILLYENANTGDTCVPDELIGINTLNIPVISKIGDPHRAKEFDVEKFHKKFKIDAYFCNLTKDFVQKYYPKNYKFKQILFGLESSLFQNLAPFKNRIKNKILNSGATASTKITNQIFCKLFRGENDPMKHYKLRTKCNELPYVVHSSNLSKQYFGNDYPKLLEQYSASIAAASLNPVMKFLEIPAAGCLAFMEITKKNQGESLGFKDGENAIFINEKNYKSRFESYLEDIDNPKWEKIANSGRNYVMNNLTNDHAVDSLVNYMEEIIQK